MSLPTPKCVISNMTLNKAHKILRIPVQKCTTYNCKILMKHICKHGYIQDLAPTGCGSWVRFCQIDRGSRGRFRPPGGVQGQSTSGCPMGKAPRKCVILGNFGLNFDAFWCIKISNYNVSFIWFCIVFMGKFCLILIYFRVSKIISYSKSLI